MSIHERYKTMSDAELAEEEHRYRVERLLIQKQYETQPKLGTVEDFKNFIEAWPRDDIPARFQEIAETLIFIDGGIKAYINFKAGFRNMTPEALILEYDDYKFKQQKAYQEEE